MTLAVRNAFIASTPLADRMAALEIADPDMARLIKRVVRRPAALRRMKVDQAVAVGAAMLATRDGRFVQAVQDALVIDRRRRVQEELFSGSEQPAMFNVSQGVTDITNDLLAGDDAAAKLSLVSWWRVLDPAALTNWMLRSPVNALAGAGLDVADHAQVFQAVLGGSLELDLAEYLPKMRTGARGAAVAQAARRYHGPLTSQVITLAAVDLDPFEAWSGITEVSDEMLERCLAPDGVLAQRLHGTAVFRLVEHRAIDPWRFTRLTLTVPQRRALCLASARIAEWDVVNAVISQWGAWSGTDSFKGGDISGLLTMAGHEAMTRKVRFECLRACSDGQLIGYATAATENEIDLVVEMLEGGADFYANVQRLFEQDITMDRTGHRRHLVQQLVRGKHAGKALRNCSTSVADVIVDELRTVLGNDAAVWRTALSLAGDWAGTLDELATAAKTLTK